MSKKSPENFSLDGSSSNTPLQVFLSARGPKIWGLYMIFKATNADKWFWLIFGCKVDQNVPIGMKLKLDV